MNRDDIKELHYWAGQADRVTDRIVDGNGMPSIRDLMQLYTAVQEIVGIANKAYHEEIDNEQK